jgi:hypothetical protein
VEQAVLIKNETNERREAGVLKLLQTVTFLELAIKPYVDSKHYLLSN